MTRTFKGLYPRIYEIENLWLAWRRARRGGKRKWPAVAAFEIDLEQNLWALQEELRDKTYRPGPYRHFTIREPKPRRISAAPFRDRVVHHALMQVTWPIFEARMISDSYACRVGRGTHKAIDRCQGFCRTCPYVLQCDVAQFFPSADHAVLRGQLARHIACPDTLWLIDRILESGIGVLDEHYDMVYFPGDDLLAAGRPRGLPIGNLTSQNWGNVYLDDLDRFVKHELHCRAYLRYTVRLCHEIGLLSEKQYLNRNNPNNRNDNNGFRVASSCRGGGPGPAGGRIGVRANARPCRRPAPSILRDSRPRPRSRPGCCSGRPKKQGPA